MFQTTNQINKWGLFLPAKPGALQACMHYWVVSCGFTIAEWWILHKQIFNQLPAMMLGFKYLKIYSICLSICTCTARLHCRKPTDHQNQTLSSNFPHNVSPIEILAFSLNSFSCVEFQDQPSHLSQLFHAGNGPRTGVPRLENWWHKSPNFLVFPVYTLYPIYIYISI